ncbi:Sensor histidine kinase RcsC [Alphaproteobacteria bacterium SO-S41]|nr:Sensor histidine kinase RcsC [Alphaproteobacteria bacterium SO-S41]
MSRSFDEAVSRIAAAPQPAWLWDAARRRIVFANPAAIAHWGEASLADLIDRRFGADDKAARQGGTPALLRDGRPGLLVMAAPAGEASTDPFFAAAPTALAVFDAEGQPVQANAEAHDLLMPGALGIVFSSPYIAADFTAELQARGLLTRTLPVATRFGLRRCRIVAKRLGQDAETQFVLAFEDIEDRLALNSESPPPPRPTVTEPVAVETEAPPLDLFTPAPPPPMPAAVIAAPSAALEEVVAALSDPTLAADASGHVIAMNAKAAQLLGESARGEPLLNMLPPDLKADAAAYIAASGARGLERALEDGRETRILRGSEHVPVRAAFARLATGEILVQFHDLSAGRAAEEALKRAREEAEIASQHKTEFLAKISHELRTPLNAIIGFAEIMEQARFGPIENERYQGYVHDIKDSGELLLSLINDLLDLTKAESGRIELDPDAVEIKPIILNVLSLLAPLAERAGVTLHPTIAKDIPAIVADERSLKQILLNLAGNAIKFNRDGGEVEVTASMDVAGAVHIAVRDTGPGMDAEDLKRAMEPYRRTKSGRGREGTGLGLPLARALTEANKAQFTLESTPGKGTVARLTFPSALVLAG